MWCHTAEFAVSTPHSHSLLDCLNCSCLRVACPVSGFSSSWDFAHILFCCKLIFLGWLLCLCLLSIRSVFYVSCPVPTLVSNHAISACLCYLFMPCSLLLIFSAPLVMYFIISHLSSLFFSVYPHVFFLCKGWFSVWLVFPFKVPLPCSATVCIKSLFTPTSFVLSCT